MPENINQLKGNESSIVAKIAVKSLYNSFGFSKAMNRDWSSEFESNMSRGYPTGSSLFIKFPPKFVFREGTDAQPQAISIGAMPITLINGGVDLVVSPNQLTYSLASLEPSVRVAAKTIQNGMNISALNMATAATYQTVGLPGFGYPQGNAAAGITLSDAVIDYLMTARSYIQAQGIPEGESDQTANLYLCSSVKLNYKTVAGMSGMFGPRSKLDKQYSKGLFIEGLGLTAFFDNSTVIQNHGTCFAGTAITSVSEPSTSYNGSVLPASVATCTLSVANISGTITSGTIITIPNMFFTSSMNPSISTGNPAQFVVKSNVATGGNQIVVSPAIITSGPNQNVSGASAVGATFGFFGGPYTSQIPPYRSSLMFHRDAFTHAEVPLAVMEAGVKTAMESFDGTSVRVTSGTAFNNLAYQMRLDTLYANAATRPELAVRLVGAV